MTLTQEQQIGVFLLLEHIAEQGAGSLDQMRRLRDLKRRVEPDDIQEIGDKLRLKASGEQYVTFTGEEIDLLEETVALIDETFQEQGRPIPEWLAAADEVVRRFRNGEYSSDG
jgi:hypothetical protein